MRLLVQVLIVAAIIQAVCYAAEEAGSASTFWTAFRRAVLANDQAKLLAMTRLPLEVHGVSDSIPPRYISRKEFSAVFKKILMQPEYLPVQGRLTTKTMLGLIYDKRRVTAKDLTTQSFFRFHQLEFEKTASGWRLTRAYLEE